MLATCFAQDSENERCGKGWVVQKRVSDLMKEGQ
jgi:hypothetical protein